MISCRLARRSACGGRLTILAKAFEQSITWVGGAGSGASLGRRPVGEAVGARPASTNANPSVVNEPMSAAALLA